MATRDNEVEGGSHEKSHPANDMWFDYAIQRVNHGVGHLSKFWI